MVEEKFCLGKRPDRTLGRDKADIASRPSVPLVARHAWRAAEVCMVESHHELHLLVIAKAALYEWEAYTPKGPEDLGHLGPFGRCKSWKLVGQALPMAMTDT